jgi:hypothetical protein
MNLFFKLFNLENENDEGQKSNHIYKIVKVEIEFENMKQALLAKKVEQMGTDTTMELTD